MFNSDFSCESSSRIPVKNFTKLVVEIVRKCFKPFFRLFILLTFFQWNLLMIRALHFKRDYKKHLANRSSRSYVPTNSSGRSGPSSPGSSLRCNLKSFAMPNVQLRRQVAPSARAIVGPFSARGLHTSATRKIPAKLVVDSVKEEVSHCTIEQFLRLWT